MRLLRLIQVKLTKRPPGLEKTSPWEWLWARPNAPLLLALMVLAPALSWTAWQMSEFVGWGEDSFRLGWWLALTVDGLLLALALDKHPQNTLWRGGRQRRALLEAEEPRRLAEHRQRFVGTEPHDEYALHYRCHNAALMAEVLRFSPVPATAQEVPNPAGFGRRRYTVEVAHQEFLDDGRDASAAGEMRARLARDAAQRETEALEFAAWVGRTRSELAERRLETRGLVLALGGHAQASGAAPPRTNGTSCA